MQNVCLHSCKIKADSIQYMYNRIFNIVIVQPVSKLPAALLSVIVHKITAGNLETGWLQMMQIGPHDKNNPGCCCIDKGRNVEQSVHFVHFVHPVS